MRNGLSVEVRFGRLEEARGGVLARSDAFSGTMYREVSAMACDGTGGAESGPIATGSASTPALDRADSSSSTGSTWQPPASASAAERSRRSSSSSLVGGWSTLRSSLTLGLRSKSSPAVAETAPPRVAVASCTGNWLSHLDWGEDRCVLSGDRQGTCRQVAMRVRELAAAWATEGLACSVKKAKKGQHCALSQLV